MSENIHLNEPFENSHFRGNTNIKRAEEVALVSENDFRKYTQEIIRCSRDIVYFANNFYYIISPAYGKHVIKTYPKQDGLLRTIEKHDRVVVLAARQTGKTTSYAIFCCHNICFNEDKKILIMANKSATAIDIISRIRLGFELLPKWMKPGSCGWNKGSLDVANGCRVEGIPTSADSARGKSCDTLIIDECAFIPSHIMYEVWQSVYPIISSAMGTKCIMVSTPNGTGNLFYETWMSSVHNQDNLDGWRSYRIDWFDVPSRDETWKRKQILSFNGDMQKWNQEFGCVNGDSNVVLQNSDAGEIRVVKMKDIWRAWESRKKVFIGK